MTKKYLRVGSVYLLAVFLLVLPACKKESGEGGPPSNSSRLESAEEHQIEIPDRKPNWKEAYAKNTDVVGWLQIPNTLVDESVVQTTNNEYYLRRSFDKKYSFEGCYYMDFESVFFDKGKDLAQNTILYGHNLGSPLGLRDDPNGTKFAQLLKFNEEKIARETPYLFFTMEEKTHVFEVFAAFYCEAALTPVPYHYAQYTPEKLAELAADAKKRSTFLYEVPVSGEDKLLTLSTCTYKYGTYTQNPYQRYVVMARLVKEGESYHEAAQLKENPVPKEPNFSSK